MKTNKNNILYTNTIKTLILCVVDLDFIVYVNNVSRSIKINVNK